MQTRQATAMRRKEGGRPMKHIAAPFSLKEAGDDGKFKGYGSVFGVVDAYGEVVAKGAFAASLEKHRREGTLPAMLWQHDARAPIGVYGTVREDDRGLYVEGQLALDVERGREAHSLLKMGAISGLSIGFMPVRWEWDSKQEVMTLQEIDLWEVSLVTFPANPAARIDGVKAIAEIKSFKEAEKALREAGFSRSEARAFIARVKAVESDQREADAGMAAFQAGVTRLAEKLSHYGEDHHAREP